MALDERVQLPGEGKLVTAIETNCEMCLDVHDLLARQRAIEVGEKLRDGLLTGELHRVLTIPRCLAHSHSSRSRIFRPRCSRDMIVPTGQSSASASSL